jgi:hypothetical protein
LNFTYRMHDSRVGRFFAIDPLFRDFPWNSPFAFSENRVLDSFEYEGCERVAISGASIPSQYDKPEGDGSTAYISNHVKTFEKQTIRLKQLYGYHPYQVLTGKDFINSLAKETKVHGEITSGAFFGHCFNEGLLFNDNEGFYSTEAKKAGGMGAATVIDLKKKMLNGEIKFSKDAVFFFDACHAAGVGGILYSETPAYEFTIATGVTTIAATGKVEMVDEKKADGRFKTTGEFLILKRVVYIETVLVKNPDKTSAWQFWKSDKIEKKQKAYRVESKSVGSEIKVDDYVKKDEKKTKR